MSEPYVGKQLSSRSFEISDTLLADYSLGLKLDIKSSPLLPSMLASSADDGYFSEIAYPYQQGHLWMRQEWDLRQPLRRDQQYRVSGAIEDIYRRRNRNVVKYRMDIANAAGDIVISTYHHQSFLRERLSSDTMEFRDPESKAGARKFELPTGKAIDGLDACISREMCGIFFHGDANYHTDRDSANKLGFDDVVVGGRMTMAYVGAALEEFFGDRWWYTGKLDLKFTNPVWCDDRLSVRGIVKDEPSHVDQTELFVWIEKEDGTKAIVAEAAASD